MYDLINREAAIKIVLDGKINVDDLSYECSNECNSILDWVAKEIDKMPSAAKSKSGYWRPICLDIWQGFECSHCLTDQNVPYINDGIPIPIWNYCPNCGAKMDAVPRRRKKNENRCRRNAERA